MLQFVRFVVFVGKEWFETLMIFQLELWSLDNVSDLVAMVHFIILDHIYFLH